MSIGAPKDNRTTDNRFVVRTDTPRNDRSWKTRCCSAAAATFLITLSVGMISANSASHAAAAHELAGTESFSFGTDSSQPYLHAVDTDTDLAPIVVAQASDSDSGGGDSSGAAADHPEMVDGDDSGWFAEGGLSIGIHDYVAVNAGVGRIFESGYYAKLRLAQGGGGRIYSPGAGADFDGTFLLISGGSEIFSGHFLGAGIGFGSVEGSSGLSTDRITYHAEYVGVLSNGLMLIGGIDLVLGTMIGVGKKF